MTRRALTTVALFVCASLPVAAHASSPANDDLADATQIASIPFTDNVDTTQATREMDELQGHGCSIDRTVWYRVRVQERTRVTIRFGTTDDQSLGLYVGSELPSMRTLECFDGRYQAEIELLPDLDYAIQLGSYSWIGTPSRGGAMTISLDPWDETWWPPLPRPPPNESPSDATTISSLPYSDWQYGVGGAPGGYRDCGGDFPRTYAKSASVWYRHVASRDGALLANAHSISETHALGVYERRNGDLALLGCGARREDMSYPREELGMLVPVTAGTEYLIHIYAADGATLRLDLEDAPSTDYSVLDLTIEGTEDDPFRTVSVDVASDQIPGSALLIVSACSPSGCSWRRESLVTWPLGSGRPVQSIGFGFNSIGCVGDFVLKAHIGATFNDDPTPSNDSKTSSVTAYTHLAGQGAGPCYP